ncbi:anti-sigma-F factor Fin family protein [Bacillus taeanensis]|uniref:Peptide ABC transporter permease n=1 Tax=Bacillus taeanensis TaxID=273032 RepID=A0A366XSD4_9BACI|nr:anti-sigma-F factor Fin family protein [Bacillus taeanensis]RBW67669.1 peptide ABC transporter permease [Bacillus taeanensis]
MAIYYNCRHCGVNVGVLEEKSLHIEQLGFHLLTNEERMEMIETDYQGNTVVKIICEDCQEALERNPVYHQLDRFIQ